MNKRVLVIATVTVLACLGCIGLDWWWSRPQQCWRADFIQCLHEARERSLQLNVPIEVSCP